jgi:hypothetical protein
MNRENGKNETRVRVEVADITGHTVMELTKAETVELVEQHGGWVFSGSRLVQAAELANADWDEMAENDATILVTPPLVGGLY